MTENRINTHTNLKKFIYWIVEEIGCINDDEQVIHKYLIQQKLIDLKIIENLDPAGLMWATTKGIDDYFA